MEGKPNGRRSGTVHSMPPLTKTDKAIYISVLVLLLLVPVFSIVGIKIFQNRIAFHDPAVIAFSAGFGAALPFLFCVVGLVCLLAAWYKLRRPIFGDKEIRYGGYPWKIYMYPLFGPRRRMADGRPEHQKLYSVLTLVFVGLFLGTLLLAFCCVFSRACLMDDLTIVEYDSLNRPGEPVSVARDCDRLTVKAKAEPIHHTFEYRYLYGVEIFGRDGKTYTFYDDDFRLRQFGHSDCLQKMLSIKALFSEDRITAERTDFLPKVIEYNRLDEAQSALLYELFDISADGHELAFQNGGRRNAGKVLLFVLCAVLACALVFLLKRRAVTEEARHRRRERRRQRKKAAYDRRKEKEARRKERQSEKSAPTGRTRFPG